MQPADRSTIDETCVHKHVGRYSVISHQEHIVALFNFSFGPTLDEANLRFTICMTLGLNFVLL